MSEQLNRHSLFASSFSRFMSWLMGNPFRIGVLSLFPEFFEGILRPDSQCRG